MTGKKLEEDSERERRTPVFVSSDSRRAARYRIMEKAAAGDVALPPRTNFQWWRTAIGTELKNNYRDATQVNNVRRIRQGLPTVDPFTDPRTGKRDPLAPPLVHAGALIEPAAGRMFDPQTGQPVVASGPGSTTCLRPVVFPNSWPE
jgi:hypothetical protein